MCENDISQVRKNEKKSYPTFPPAKKENCIMHIDEHDIVFCFSRCLISEVFQRSCEGMLNFQIFQRSVKGGCFDYERIFQRSLGLRKGITYWKESGL
jgi:hypothetical protein